MVTDNTGVINEVPVPTNVPPVAASYQLIVPAEAIALRVTVPVPHTDPGVVPVTVGIAVTVATTAVLEAVVQVPVVAST